LVGGCAASQGWDGCVLGAGRGGGGGEGRSVVERLHALVVGRTELCGGKLDGGLLVGWGGGGLLRAVRAAGRRLVGVATLVRGGGGWFFGGGGCVVCLLVVCFVGWLGVCLVVCEWVGWVIGVGFFCFGVWC